jgi:hypothetical protein
MKSSRLFVAIALAAMLVFVQQAGALHKLSHIGDADATEQQKHHPGEVFDQCLALAHIHGAPPGRFFIPLVTLQSHFDFNDALPARLLRAAHYWSRAPPASS